MPAPTRNQHNLPLILDQPDELLGDRGHTIVVERAVFVGEDAGADLDDDGPRISGDFLPNGIEHIEDNCLEKSKSWRRRPRRILPEKGVETPATIPS
jgi:hypothetical protein